MFHMKIDKKDMKIIEVLKEHGEYTSRQISKKTIFPLTTVHNRIKKLREHGIIKKYTIKLDNKKLDKNLAAYILVSADYKILKNKNRTQHQLAKEIKKLSEVERADVMTGDIDIIIFARTTNMEEMDKFLLEKLQNIIGIDKTKTLMILHESD